MPRGPLPKPDDQRRRRNAPTIPTTNLPRSGRPEPAPPCPYDLGPAGAEWWSWAWTTPQACGWDEVGHLFTVARRAQLEDDLRAIEDVALDLGVDELLDPDLKKAIQQAMRSLKGLCGGKVSVCREMRELDTSLGLNPKGLAALRWQIVADVDAAVDEPDDEPDIDRFAGLRAVG